MGVRVGFLDPKPAGAAAAGAGVLVPALALRTDGGGPVVFVYADGKVERRSVTLGPDTAGQRRVLSGLRDGERVVVAAPPSLKDGQAVKPAEGK
jgi:multidrug efflux pump subunit AcrA (membrane-fusion protein)